MTLLGKRYAIDRLEGGAFFRNIGLFEEYEPDVSREETAEEEESDSSSESSSLSSEE